jgi:hypothetical protein
MAAVQTMLVQRYDGLTKEAQEGATYAIIPMTARRENQNRIAWPSSVGSGKGGF